MFFPQLQLTVGHILHSCDHRASQVNGTERVVTLVASVGVESVSTGEKEGKDVASEEHGLPSCWHLLADIYLCWVVIMQVSGIVPQRELPHLPVFPPVTL